MRDYRVIRILVAAIVSLAASKPEGPVDPVEDSQAAAELLENAQAVLNRIDAEYAKWSNKRTLAEWNYASNLTDENLAEKINVSTAAARVMKQIAEEVNAFPWKNLEDENLKRQFSKLGILGVAALQYCEDLRLQE